MMKRCDYKQEHGKFLCLLHDIIVIAIKTLAVLTVFVIILAVINVALIILKSLSDFGITLTLTQFFVIFGELLLVLIAVEIFQNIIMYIRTDVIPIKLVLATALIAVARKFIIIDKQEVDVYYILSLAVGVVALSIAY